MAGQVSAPSKVLGCDIGKEEIVVFDATSGRFARLANQAEALADFAKRSIPIASSFARRPADTNCRCWPPCSRPASPPIAPTRARSKPSSDPSERWARATPSTPRRWPDTPPSAGMSCRDGALATNFA